MRVLMKTTSAGPEGTRRAGQTYDVPTAEGQALIAGGYAEPARSVPVETADASRDGERAERKPEVDKGGRGKGDKD